MKQGRVRAGVPRKVRFGGAHFDAHARHFASPWVPRAVLPRIIPAVCAEERPARVFAVGVDDEVAPCDGVVRRRVVLQQRVQRPEHRQHLRHRPAPPRLRGVVRGRLVPEHPTRYEEQVGFVDVLGPGERPVDDQTGD